MGKRWVLVVVAVLTLGACGDGGGQAPDWEGLAAWVNETGNRDEPATASEMRERFGDADCDSDGDSIGRAIIESGEPSGVTVEEYVALDYFLCGEDYAIEMARSIGEADTARQVIAELKGR